MPPEVFGRQRIIIGAELVGAPAAASPPAVEVPAAPVPVPAPPPQPRLDELDEPAERGPAGVRAVVALTVWLVVWLCARRWHRWRWAIYLGGSAPFLVALFLFFEAFSELLPASC